MNMFGSLNGSFLKTSRKNIISNLSFKWSCIRWIQNMHLQSPTSMPFFLQCWWLLFTDRTHTRIFFTSHDQQHSILLSMTLVTKIVGKHHSDHLINTLKNTTMSLFIGMVKFSAELSWNEIMIEKLSISRWQITSTRILYDYTILLQ